MSTWKRCHLLFDRNSSGAPLRWSSTVSPAIFTNPPSGMAAILYSVPPRVKPSRRRTETDRKGEHSHADAPGREEMPQLVDENEHADHKSERQERRQHGFGPLHWQF